MNNAELTFEALVNAYSADLYRYAYWLCRDRQLAEDLVQESFMRAWRALDKLQNPESARAWLFTILRRELSRHLGKVRMMEVSLESTELHDEHFSSLSETPDQISNWALHRALNNLDQGYLEPLLLQVIGGYSCEEIGDMLGTSAGAIMTRVCRARQELRKSLGKETAINKRVKR